MSTNGRDRGPESALDDVHSRQTVSGGGPHEAATVAAPYYKEPRNELWRAHRALGDLVHTDQFSQNLSVEVQRASISNQDHILSVAMQLQDYCFQLTYSDPPQGDIDQTWWEQIVKLRSLASEIAPLILGSYVPQLGQLLDAVFGYCMWVDLYQIQLQRKQDIINFDVYHTCTSRFSEIDLAIGRLKQIVAVLSNDQAAEFIAGFARKVDERCENEVTHVFRYTTVFTELQSRLRALRLVIQHVPNNNAWKEQVAVHLDRIRESVNQLLESLHELKATGYFQPSGIMGGFANPNDFDDERTVVDNDVTTIEGIARDLAAVVAEKEHRKSGEGHGNT